MELTTWQQVEDAIGSANGDHFRTFAQSLRLEQLVQLANEHLDSFRKRYQLARSTEADLSLHVIDNDMGKNTVRSAYDPAAFNRLLECASELGSNLEGTERISAVITAGSARWDSSWAAANGREDWNDFSFFVVIETGERRTGPTYVFRRLAEREAFPNAEPPTATELWRASRSKNIDTFTTRSLETRTWPRHTNVSLQYIRWKSSGTPQRGES